MDDGEDAKLACTRDLSSDAKSGRGTKPGGQSEVEAYDPERVQSEGLACEDEGTLADATQSLLLTRTLSANIGFSSVHRRRVFILSHAHLHAHFRTSCCCPCQLMTHSSSSFASTFGLSFLRCFSTKRTRLPSLQRPFLIITHALLLPLSFNKDNQRPTPFYFLRQHHTSSSTTTTSPSTVTLSSSDSHNLLSLPAYSSQLQHHLPPSFRFYHILYSSGNDD